MLFSRSADVGAADLAASGSKERAGFASAALTERWFALAAYGGVAFVTVGGFVSQTGTWFRGRDWAGLTFYHDGPSLQPVDGTLSVTSGAVLGLVSRFAGWAFWPHRLIAASAFALALVVVFRYARRVAGPEVGLLATAVLASFTHAAALLTQPFAMRFPLSVAMVVALAHVLDVGSRSRGEPIGHRAGTIGADIVACGLFAAALATSIVGLAATPLLLSALAAQPTRWRRWALHLAPLPLWLAWFAWRGSFDTKPWSWTSRAQYLANLIGRSFQHLACNSATLAAVVAAGVVLVLWSDPNRRLDVSWRPARWLAAGGVFAVLSTYREGSVWLRPLGGDPPDTHSWVVAAFLVLAVVESVRNRHRGIPESWRQTGLGALAVAVALSSVTLLHALEAARENAADDHGLDVEVLASVESVSRLTDDSWTISIDSAQLPARQYQSLVDDLGSPLEYFDMTPNESQEALRARDLIVIDGLGITAEAGGCQWTPDPSSTLEVARRARVAVASLDATTAADVFLARLAEPSLRDDPLASVEPGSVAIVTLPDPGDGHVWSISVEGFGVLGTCVD